MARRHTPYYHQFVALGAELVDRIGFDAAFRFTTVEEEHLATRSAAGLYDVYYQGAIDVKGRDAESFLNGVLVNDVRRLTDGGILYSSVPNESGGMIDDLTVYRFSAEHYWLCATPSRVDRVVAHLSEQAEGRLAYVTNCVPGTAYLSIQGPRSREILAGLTSLDLSTEACPTTGSAGGRWPRCRSSWRARAIQASWATSCSIRATTPITCGWPCSRRASRMA